MTQTYTGVAQLAVFSTALREFVVLDGETTKGLTSGISTYQNVVDKSVNFGSDFVGTCSRLAENSPQESPASISKM
jgi:hypothetical protein